MASFQVALLMGSKSDLPKLQPAIDLLREFAVPVTVRVMSAHRTPDVVSRFVAEAEAAGVQVFIAAAGLAAHLAGAVAAQTAKPVIGIPVEGGPFDGLDALLATVQMPGGIPVATVAVGKGGVKNAALLAVQILALQCPPLAQRLAEFRQRQRQETIAADAELQAELGQA